MAKGAKIVQLTTIQGRGLIDIGKNSQLGVYPSPGFRRGEFYIEARSEKARVIIGESVIINNGCILIADKTIIEIGNNTLIGPDFFCVDSDFHSLDPEKRLSYDYKCKSVKIGKNVFIGAKVTILKGVSIGDNSIIAAGSIVFKDVPSDFTFVGKYEKFLE